LYGIVNKQYTIDKSSSFDINPNTSLPITRKPPK
jgi:hypothetical protein